MKHPGNPYTRAGRYLEAACPGYPRKVAKADHYEKAEQAALADEDMDAFSVLKRARRYAAAQEYA